MCAGENASCQLACLRAGETHVWLSFIDNDPAPDENFFLARLSETERARAKKIVPPDGRLHFIFAHTLLRAVLSQYHLVEPDAWQFGRGAQGKPFIRAPAEAPPLQFNLTHTRGLAACVIALNAAAGVDAEYLEPHADLLDMARQFLPAPAARELENLAGEQRTLRFYEHWTRQEACSKACGAGLAALPEAMEPDPGWQFVQQCVSADHILAAVVRGRPGKSVVFKLRTAGWELDAGKLRLKLIEPERAVAARPIRQAHG